MTIPAGTGSTPEPTTTALPSTSTPLLTLAELSVWVGDPIASDDLWAQVVIEAASDRVRTAALQPDWTSSTAPARARQIASHLAARSYVNRTSVSAEGAIGPLGGDRVVEELAKALHLTAAEVEELAGMAPGAGAVTGKRGLWVQPLRTEDPAPEGDAYLFDSTGSDWGIPYLPEDYPWRALG